MQLIFPLPGCLYLRNRLWCCCLFTGLENTFINKFSSEMLWQLGDVSNQQVFTADGAGVGLGRMAGWLHGRNFSLLPISCWMLCFLWRLLCVTACGDSFLLRWVLLSVLLFPHLHVKWQMQGNKTIPTPHTSEGEEINKINSLFCSDYKVLPLSLCHAGSILPKEFRF